MRTSRRLVRRGPQTPVVLRQLQLRPCSNGLCVDTRRDRKRLLRVRTGSPRESTARWPSDQISAGAEGIRESESSVRPPRISRNLRLVVLAAIVTAILAILILGVRFIACACAEPQWPVVCGCFPPSSLPTRWVSSVEAELRRSCTVARSRRVARATVPDDEAIALARKHSTMAIG